MPTDCEFKSSGRAPLILAVLMCSMLATAAHAELDWADDDVSLPGEPGLQHHVTVLIQTDVSQSAEADMRPLGEPRTLEPFDVVAVEDIKSPQPATLAVAGLGLATLLAGKSKRRAD